MLINQTGLEDGERFVATLIMIGRVILATLHALERADLLKKDSPIPNIPLILSLFLHASKDGDEGLLLTESAQWPNIIVAYADKHNIDIKGVFDVTGEDYPADDLDDEMFDLVNKKSRAADKWKIKTEWAAFSRKYGGRRGRLGGNEFDIFKMSKWERIDAAFDKKDPVATMPKPPPEDIDTDAEESASAEKEDDEWEDVDEDDD